MRAQLWLGVGPAAGKNGFDGKVAATFDFPTSATLLM
jgi:hypothetical protein